ncbi:MAG TPA: DUF4178 domain-containing protein [Bryobacteraceae bacterium]|nr:DUF4178 domain-containing protein [Bryobacteraceae bacterium]
MSSSLVTPPLVKAKSLSCPNCGAPVELRGFAHTLSAVCPNCLSVLDTSSPELQVLDTFQGKERVQPKIPLGTRGTFNGTVYEVIGFQERSVQSGGDFYSWDEYLLFNPYKGFRYLTEYCGHWNVVRALSRVPETARARGRQAWRLDGRTFAAFDAMTAATSYVIGEFPWQVCRGETVRCEDYISPPYMLSAESTGDEVTWSMGEYWPGSKIWQAFRLAGSPPYAQGVFSNQPSPFAGKIGSAWRTWLWLNVALFVLFLLFTFMKANREVFRQDYVYLSGKSSEAAFVTPPFQLNGGDKNVEVGVHASVDNDWIYLNFALINDETGQTFDFAREVSYYHDSDGTEGSRNNSVVIPSVPGGRYYLRIEPEMSPSSPSTRYEVFVRRDVPIYSYFWIAAMLLLIPPIVVLIRSVKFEGLRWRESDYAPASSGGDD